MALPQGLPLGSETTELHKKGNLDMADEKPGDRQKALELAMTQIERSHGKGSIQRFGEQLTADGIETIPSGCLSPSQVSPRPGLLER